MQSLCFKFWTSQLLPLQLHWSKEPKIRNSDLVLHDADEFALRDLHQIRSNILLRINCGDRNDTKSERMAGTVLELLWLDFLWNALWWRDAFLFHASGRVDGRETHCEDFDPGV